LFIPCHAPRECWESLASTGGSLPNQAPCDSACPFMLSCLGFSMVLINKSCKHYVWSGFPCLSVFSLGLWILVFTTRKQILHFTRGLHSLKELGTETFDDEVTTRMCTCAQLYSIPIELSGQSHGVMLCNHHQEILLFFTSNLFL
jgi:hypothetical protein